MYSTILESNPKDPFRITDIFLVVIDFINSVIKVLNKLIGIVGIILFYPLIFIIYMPILYFGLIFITKRLEKTIDSIIAKDDKEVIIKTYLKFQNLITKRINKKDIKKVRKPLLTRIFANRIIEFLDEIERIQIKLRKAGFPDASKFGITPEDTLRIITSSKNFYKTEEGDMSEYDLELYRSASSKS